MAEVRSTHYLPGIQRRPTLLEYKIIERDSDKKAEKELNEALRQGWELADFKMRRKYQSDEYIFLMRRGA